MQDLLHPQSSVNLDQRYPVLWDSMGMMSLGIWQLGSDLQPANSGGENSLISVIAIERKTGKNLKYTPKVS